MQEELNKYLDAIAADYNLWCSDMKDPQAHAAKVKQFRDGLEISEGTKFFKVIKKNYDDKSVHSFIVKEDSIKFKKGDILKAASWNAPAMNKPRGNVFGEYHVLWTGAQYLK